MAQNIIGPLTLEQLREMDGQKVLLYRMKSTEPLEPGTVKQNGDVLGDAGMLAYHELYLETWVAFTYHPAHIDREAWVSVSERMPDEDQVVIVIANGKPRENITLDGAFELAEWSERDGWFLECWPEWETPVVTHWMPIPVPPEEAERCAGTI